MWLDKKWLVTCCNELGGLFKFNPRTNEYQKLLDEDCRGIAKYKDHYVMATTSSGLMLLDKKFRVIRTDRRPFLDYHGVAISKNFAYAVETHRNAIGIFRLPDLEKVQEIQLFPEEEDILHMNDLFIYKDRLFISMFSLDGHWRPQKERASGGIMEFSLAAKQLVQIHFPQSIHHPHRSDPLVHWPFWCWKVNHLQSFGRPASGARSEGRNLGWRCPS